MLVRKASVVLSCREELSMCNLGIFLFVFLIGLCLPGLSQQRVRVPENHEGKVDPSSVYLVKNEEPAQLTIHGLVPPVFTPLNEDGSVNLEGIFPYAKFLADAGIKGVLVGGTTGEATSLSKEDRKQVLDAWINAREFLDLHIMVQVGGAPLPDVLELAKHAVEVGADSILTLPELYFKPTTVDGLVSYVQLVADAAPSLPVLYYHIPQNTKVEIDMPSFVKEATAKIPNFKGLKFSSRVLTEAAEVKRNLKEGQEIFLGTNELFAPAMLMGIRSFIPSSTNMFPELAQEIIAAVENNDFDKARSLGTKQSLIAEVLSNEGRSALRVGMKLATGIDVGPPALPLKPLSAEGTQRVEDTFRSLGLLKM